MQCPTHRPGLHPDAYSSNGDIARPIDRLTENCRYFHTISGSTKASKKTVNLSRTYEFERLS